MSDTAQLIVLEREDLAAVVEAGPRDPVLGGLIDLGTVALLASDLGPATLRALAGDRASIEALTVDDAASGEAARARLERAARAGRVLVLVWDVGQTHRPLLILAGRGLPNLGFVGVCGRERLAGTLAFLLEGAPAAVDTLLAEPDDAVRPEERDLMQRLTKLYGD